MPRLRFTASEAEEYQTLLAETIRRIRDSTAGFDDEHLGTRAQRDEWSPAEVLGHLRACAEVWSDSIYAMLAHENPALPDIHPRRWAKERGYLQAAFRPSFTVFLVQRQQLLSVLHKLPDEDWNRSADIGGRRHSVFSQVRRMARHEALHCTQMEMLLASRREVR